jgi:mRNA interferase YafQ
MIISYSRNFIKQSKKLNKNVSHKLIDRIELFVQNPLDPELNNHPLKGKYKAYRSINITGDYRALYLSKDEYIVFDVVGTHSQLYG